uniref:EGF-like domain-containing protein n=1 Tax=Ascaris lumbricoides TaxID=6252 RepID=A0A0M3IKY8_ASCLU
MSIRLGFNGSRCEFRQPSVCDTEPCGTNGRCLLTKSTDEYRCECERGFMGKSRLNYVVIRSFCLSFMSFNGSRCEFRQPSVCDTEPCGTNGRCLLTKSTDEYRCECERGFMGKSRLNYLYGQHMCPFALSILLSHSTTFYIFEHIDPVIL